MDQVHIQVQFNKTKLIEFQLDDSTKVIFLVVISLQQVRYNYLNA